MNKRVSPKSQKISWPPEYAAGLISSLLQSKEPTLENLEAIKIPLGKKVVKDASDEGARMFGEELLRVGVPLILRKRKREQMNIWLLRLRLLAGLVLVFYILVQLCWVVFFFE